LKTIKAIKMASGGRRRGAGRKAGAATTRTRAIADKAAETGILPLDVMLDNMRHFHKVALEAEAVLEWLTAEDFTGVKLDPADQFKVLLAEVKKAAGLRQMAQECARDAAAYLHPRLTAVAPQRADDDFVPLAERLKYYARRDALEASTPNVDELKKPGERDDEPPRQRN
jgi:hypothetical protein